MRSFKKTKDITLFLCVSTLFALNYAYAFNNYGITDNPLDPRVMAQSSSGGGDSSGGSGGSSDAMPENIPEHLKPYYLIPHDTPLCLSWITNIKLIGGNPIVAESMLSGYGFQKGTMISGSDLSMFSGNIPETSPYTFELSDGYTVIEVTTETLTSYDRKCTPVSQKQVNSCSPAIWKTTVPCSGCSI